VRARCDILSDVLLGSASLSVASGGAPLAFHDFSTPEKVPWTRPPLGASPSAVAGGMVAGIAAHKSYC